jgi:outer membrane protein TolC
MRMRILRGIVVGALIVAAAARGRAAEVEVMWMSAKPQPAPAIIPVVAREQVPVVPPPMLPPALPTPEPATSDGRRPLPINLPTALKLASARPLDIQIASRQVQAAAARFDAARVLWVPSLLSGVDYFRHDGVIQAVPGDLLTTSRSSFMVGGSLNAVFGLNDAIFSPLAARQDLGARRANMQAVSNDVALAVAEAYFNVQQARGELAGALAYEKGAEELARRTQSLAEGLAPPPEAARARVELARRRQAVAALRERWQLAGSDLLRLLRLDPGSSVEPVEPPNLIVTLIEPARSLDDLIVLGLTTRPELTANQAIVRATLQRLRQEKLRPLVPSVLLRGASTNPAGTLGAGVFGGGTNGRLADFNGRLDYDVQVLWELQNFGLGNKARIDERRAEKEIAMLELFRTQDRVAAEIAQAYAQARSAADRLAAAEPATKDAVETFTRSMEGLAQTRRVGNTLVLIVRPLEAVTALQTLAQANTDYFAAVADYNRAQFRLWRALGQPAQCLADQIQK